MHYGLTSGVHLASSDIINVSAHTDVLFTGGKPRASASGDVGLGSYMAAVVTPVALLIVMVANSYHGGT